jgi:hypothetical protein
MTAKIVQLPRDFIGKDDEQKLESWGAHLLARGRATRWKWTREHGFDVAFEIFIGGVDEMLAFSIRRDQRNDIFYVTDRKGRIMDNGRLDRIMATVDIFAQQLQGDQPA